MTPELVLPIDGEAADAEAATEALRMDEQEFRAFHLRTARPLRAYMCHLTGNAALSDDLVQEAYYRFLRADLPEMTEEYRKNYLYKIATNLVRDHFRGSKHAMVPLPESLPGAPGGGETAGLRADLAEAMNSLKPRQREILWLAYVEGASHKEIAEATGVKAQSIRPLLFRAKQKLAELLRSRGFAPGTR